MLAIRTSAFVTLLLVKSYQLWFYYTERAVEKNNTLLTVPTKYISPVVALISYYIAKVYLSAIPLPDETVVKDVVFDYILPVAEMVLSIALSIEVIYAHYHEHAFRFKYNI